MLSLLCFKYQSGELLELFRKLPLFDTQHFHLSTYTHSSIEHLLSPSYVVEHDGHFKNSMSCSHDIYYMYYTTLIAIYTFIKIWNTY